VETPVLLKSDVELEAIYRDHGSRLWWAVLAYTGDREIASDAVAEAFAQALRRGDDLRNPLPWVWKSAFRIAAGELERRRKHVPLEDATYHMPEPTDLFAALARLSPNQRAAVVLHYYVGYRLSEVARILGSTKSTVSVHLVRGRRRLKELLEEGDE
jgi:RNA polymerase sigma factor (sigma-70 family)